jgi:putative oxidoreductase
MEWKMAATVVQSNARKIGVWVLRVLLGVAFLLAACMKLGGRAAMVTEFDVVGLGQWFRYFTGIVELIGGIAILVPPVSIFGAMLLLVVDFGALVAQLTVLHGDWIHTIVIAVLLCLLIYIQRSRLKATASAP